VSATPSSAAELRPARNRPAVLYWLWAVYGRSTGRHGVCDPRDL